MDITHRDLRRQIINSIINLVQAEKLKEANILIDEYLNVVHDDVEGYSIKAVILIMQQQLGSAENVIRDGLKIDENNFDLNYNLAYIYENLNKNENAIYQYNIALSLCFDENVKSEILKTINNIKGISMVQNNLKRTKIAFFVKQGMDSFLGDIIEGISDIYETKKIVVTQYNQVDEGMKWADICWFEWCDELIDYGSKHKLAKERIIFCRLHRYEVFTNVPKSVEWENVDKLIIVTNHLRKFLVSSVPNIEKLVDIVTIVNGVNLNQYELKERNIGFNIAYVGYIHSRKNPVLLLQTINELVKKDCRYKLFIAGQFQEPLVELYWNYQIMMMGLEKNVIFEGWQNDINRWLEDKNYILSTSIHESFGYGIAEAMARGIKPIIHNFLFADEIWDKKYLFNSISEAVEMITEKKYNSESYRKFIKDNYSLDDQIIRVKKLTFRALNENKNNSQKDNKHEIIKEEDILNYTENMLRKKAVFPKLSDITMIIPTYNRANILKKDLSLGYKLGNIRKIIIDDNSNEADKKILKQILNNNSFNIDKIILHDENEGVAKAINDGVANIHTKYSMFCGDDDIIFASNHKLFNNSFNLINDDYLFIIPRYVINLDSAGGLTIGYDRLLFDEVTSLDVLKNFFLSGEMYAFNAGAVYDNSNLIRVLPEEFFKVSEDYVMMSRLLGENANKKIKVSEHYIYVRRVSNTTLSKQIDKNKLSLNLFSILISGYYCLKEDIVSYQDVKESILKRGDLLEEIYGYGSEFAQILTKYLNKLINYEDFIDLVKQQKLINGMSIENIPREVKLILNYSK